MFPTEFFSSSCSSQSTIRQAGTVVVGDALLDASNGKCHVTSVQPLPEDDYYGLNCVTSEVVANGLRTSTFGDYHHLPALWMRVAGGALGIARASAIGDAIASAFYRLFHH